MKKVITAIALTLAFPLHSMALNNNIANFVTPNDICMDMKAASKDLYKWRDSFEKYIDSYDSKSEQDRFNTNQAAIKKFMTLSNYFSDASGIKKDSFREAKEVLGYVEYNIYSRDELNLRMKKALLRLDKSIDASISLAQTANKDCDLGPVKINMMTAPSASATSSSSATKGVKD